MAKPCFILQVVGFQNSGKTTLMEKLIARTSQHGLIPASIKHHGHGGVPDQTLELKDSARHQRAGAMIAGVEGEGVWQFTMKQAHFSLKECLRLYQTFSVDVILIEGYKQADYPKAVLLRNEEDLCLLDSLTNIQCVICWKALDDPNLEKYPVFLLKEEEQYMNFLMEIVRN
ncbi:molybdopterin-guanine dinucleotide biosynthesis protein B [Bacillus xiapuensis]|uniref:molybdopterin-guanine dinucleotide biosynthesis protein B n=1 Tax=Bacillus xiapuensis TaxID=2014075 RepID=UPI001E2DB6B3|nr:molybdopterin-guanine dinucleotide biosynthesis protein B [Bacillus xiapuensis]